MDNAPPEPALLPIQWEERIRRVLRGEYPQQVWTRMEDMTADMRRAMDALYEERRTSKGLRDKIGGTLETLLLESSNMTVGLSRKIESMRKAMKDQP